MQLTDLTVCFLLTSVKLCLEGRAPPQFTTSARPHPAAKMHGCQSYELIEWPCSTEKAASPIKVARSASAARTAVSGAFRHWPIADNSSCAHMHLEPSSRTKRAASNATPLFLDGDRVSQGVCRSRFKNGGSCEETIGFLPSRIATPMSASSCFVSSTKAIGLHLFG